MKKLLVLALLVIAACAAPAELEPQLCCKALTASCLACTEGVSVEQYCADNPETVGCEEPEEAPELIPKIEVLPFDGPTQELQAKGVQTTNYKFNYAPLPENKAQRTYYVNDDKVRVELYKPSLRDAGTYDVVYLDLAEQKAVGYCELGTTRMCPEPENVIERPDFNDYYIELPHELMGRLDNGELVGSVTYDGHVSDFVETQLDGVYYRLTINRFHGTPMNIEIYENPEHTGETFGQQNRDFSFNTVTEEQVTPPGGW